MLTPRIPSLTQRTVACAGELGEQITLAQHFAYCCEEGAQVETSAPRTPLSRAILYTGSGHLPIPDWAAWLSELGAWAGNLALEGVRGTIALSVPVREYASVLLGCGVVYATFRPQLNRSSNGSQFAKAALLPPGRYAVRLIPTHSSTAFVGILNETSTKRGQEGYNVSGAWFPADRYRIDVLQWPDDPANFRGQTRISEQLEVGLAGDTVGLLPGQLADFCGFSSLHCAIVGNSATLKRESEMLVTASQTARPMPFSALLRPRTIQETARQFRSVLLSSRDPLDDYRKFLARRRAKVAILDGALSVSRWLTTALAPINIGLVERTAVSADIAGDVLYRDRARSVRDLPLPPDLARIPSGIEVLAWHGIGAA